MESKHQFSIWYALGVLLLLFALQYAFEDSQTLRLDYSDFKVLLNAGQLTDLKLSADRISGTLKVEGVDRWLAPKLAADIKKAAKPEAPFVTVRVEDPQLVSDLEAKHVRYAGEAQSPWLLTLLSWILPAVFFVAIWTVLAKRVSGAGALMEVGKSKAKVYLEKETGVHFEDVAGVDEAKEELQELVAFLKDPQRYGKLGARIPKGVLLVGPPGTGKTLLARAVAGEAGVPFLSISGAEFVEMFVGVGAARVRDLFERARARAPAIIFIDELDALGRARGAYPNLGSHDEKEQTLNQLLSEMDGFDPSVGLVLLAATNRPEILDPALLRAGRFDRQVLVDRPDKRGRVDILKVHLKKIRLSADIDPEQIAALTPGFSGADLANLVNEAALLATRRNADSVALDDFTLAVERIVAGLEKRNRLLNPAERKVVAFHEMGHALVALCLPGVDPIHKISIIPRGVSALGYTIQRPTEDRYLMTQTELENKMAVLLGGRAAEQLVFQELSTGAADDLLKATEIARSLVMRYGMSAKLGAVAYETQPPSFLIPPAGANGLRDFSEETAREIDCAVRDIVAAALKRALQILDMQRSVLEAGAGQLLEKETLSEAEIKEIRGRLRRELAA